MENLNYIYDAFISYRHLPLDKDVADRLQKLLEKRRFVFPGDKGKKKRNLKIFVDKSELPTSGNLGDDIKNALKQSRFLIILYSKETKESRWCMEELRYFRSLHGDTNQNILPMLIEGEPDEVFPEDIRWETHRTQNQQGEWEDVRTYVEPLGADIRAQKRKDVFRKLKTEYMRIQAPILNCRFDDLYQRTKRRSRRILTALTVSIIIVSVGFGAYNARMLQRIVRERQGMLQSEANRLAEHAQVQREENDILLSILLAKEALKLDQTEPGEISRAETALRSAVLQSVFHKEKKYVDMVARISFNLSQWWIGDSYAGGTKITVTDFEDTYLFDTANGDLLFSCPGEEVYFNEDASRCAQILYGYENSERLITVTGFHTDTGEQYFTFHSNCEYGDVFFAIYDEETDDCYIGKQKYDYDGGESQIDILTRYTSNGLEEKNFSVAESILEKCHDWRYLTSYFNVEYEDLFLNLDYTKDDMKKQEVDERERAIISYCEELGWNPSGAVHAQEGNLLLVPVYPAGGSIYDAQTFVFSLEPLAYCAAFDGTAFLDRNSGLLYRQNGETLDILKFHQENAGIKEGATQQYQYVSADGTKALKMILDNVRVTGYGTLSVHSVEDFNTPLLETRVYMTPYDNGKILYFFTPQMDKVFLADENLTLQLWEVGEGCTLEFTPTEGWTPDAVAVDDAGGRLAIAYTDSSYESYKDYKHYVELRSAKDGEVVDIFEVEEACSHLEFQDSLLLVSSTNQSLLIDLMGNTEAVVFEFGNQTHPSNHFLTNDGLLFCTENVNTMYSLVDIFDIQTGASVSPVDEARAYSYDSDSRYLAYQAMNYGTYSNSVHVAKRTEDGTFEELYSFRPRGTNMQMLPSGDGMEGKYLLLNNDESSEVYDLDTGEQILSIQGNTFQLHNGKLCDMRDDGSEYMVSLELFMVGESLLEQAEQILTGNYTVRELNEFEKERFWVQDILE